MTVRIRMAASILVIVVAGCGPSSGPTLTHDPSAGPVDEPAVGLIGTWDLVEMGATADFARIVPTIAFGAEGKLSGFAGCNTFSGTFSTNGAALTLGALATTKMACERPASAVEADYLLALSGVTGWSIEPDGRLALEGTVPLRYARH